MMDSVAQVPEVMEVMALPETVLFPGALLPLFIFEPRYRFMLARALETDRMFAIGLMRTRQEGVFPIGCAGLVRACVANPDGTSHVMLQGVARVRLVEELAGEPFPRVKAMALTSEDPPPAAAEMLRGEIRSLCARLRSEHGEVSRQVEMLLERAPDLAEFSDLAGSTIVHDTAIRQRLLEELNVTNRLAILAAFLSGLGTAE